jgi:hypothetical protein
MVNPRIELHWQKSSRKNPTSVHLQIVDALGSFQFINEEFFLFMEGNPTKEEKNDRFKRD